MAGNSGQFKRSDSLAYRLSLSVAVVIFISMMATSAILSYLAFKREIDQHTVSLEATAKVFSTSIADSLSAGDRHTVRRILTGIGKFPQFRFAAVTDRNGGPFAEVGYGAVLSRNNVDLTEQTTFDLLTRNELWVRSDIYKAGEVIGEIRLLSDISAIKHGLFVNFGITLALAFFAALATVVLSLRSVSILTKPIVALSALMQKFGEEEDFRVRAENNAKGEVGVLARSFNKMLEDLALRNRELLDYQDSLEQKVETRTHELLAAKNEAERANASKSEFLATMSHEIRTPMNGMLVMAELLATAGLAPKYQRYADVVMKSGRGLLAIINDVLDFSKIESGSLELEKIPVDLRSLTEDVLSLFWQQASEKGLDLGCMVAPGLPQTIVGDPVRLNQVLSNLVNNALKFTATGQITIHITRPEEAESGRGIVIAVHDTGIGIHRDKLASVFESFTQADQSTTRKYGGTGLGLPICKKLVESMGGEIWVESEPGAGATFGFTLPLEAIDSQSVLRDAARGKNVLLALPVSATYQVLRDALEQQNADAKLIYPDQIFDIEESGFDLVITSPDVVEKMGPVPEGTHRLVVTQLGDFSADALISSERVHDILPMPVSTYSAIEAIERVLSGHARGKALLEADQSAQRSVQTYQGMNILVVDDSAVNREVVVQALRRFDVQPVVAENGLEAIAATRGARFDLIFMDCSMPEMDGFQATELIRKNEQLEGASRTPVVALTAHIAEHISEQWKAAGMDDIVVKPFTMDALGSCLSKWLEGNGVAVQTEPREAVVPTLSAEMDGADILDREAQENLREILGDMFDDSFVRILNLYVETAPGAFEKLQSTYRSGDLQELSAAAHALKSITANATATRFADVCSRLEKAANGMDQTSIDALINEAEAEYAEAFLAVEKMLEELQSSQNRANAECA
jgi:two-component system sensor histidine kinase BarA